MDAYHGAPLEDRSTLIAALGGAVLGIDRLTGALRWENRLAGGGRFEVFLGYQHGVLVASAHGAKVYRIDPRTGATLWENSTSASGRATILVEPDMIVVAKGGEIDAFDHHGRRGWSQQLRGRGLGPMALALPGNVAQADDRGSD